MTKYVFVTGGVVSGLGKGITAASLGRLLKARGVSVMAQKLDPYINVDPGTMSPYQHGEVFVTKDGAETDLDLGHYERFIDVELNKYSNLTTGKVYWNVLNKERLGKYLGETVQVIPHITNEIKSFIYGVAEKEKPDVVITEIGGTAGDIESQPFLEAIRQVALDVGRENSLFIHVTLVPYLESSNELKSKPTQHSVKELRSMGITPDIIVLRADVSIDDESTFQKVALFCNVTRDCVIENRTISSIYEAPLMLEEQNFSDIVARKLNLELPKADLLEWKELVERIHNLNEVKTIAICGKYVKLHDAYLSVLEACRHAGFAFGLDIKFKWVDSELVDDKNAKESFEGADAIILPGGFGKRGIEGMVSSVKYARENNIPFLGICLGMQVVSIEFARNVCKMERANSFEFDETTPYPVIYMESESSEIEKGGKMRLGDFPCKIKPETKMSMCYGKSEISERHRHRYEFNNKYRKNMEENGLVISGTSDDEKIVEAIEIPKNEFFVAVQFHPEFKSRPNRPHPLFTGLIEATLNMPVR